MANGSFSSKSPISPRVTPVCARSFSVAGTGPRPIRCGSTPAYAKPTSRIFASRPSSAAAPVEAISPAVAPSVRPAELPAVTRPPGRNGVRSSASASIVVSGRRYSSRSATAQPSSVNTAIGTTVSFITPFCHAAAALRWDATA